MKNNLKFKVIDIVAKKEADETMPFVLNQDGVLLLPKELCDDAFYPADAKYKVVRFTGYYINGEEKPENEIYEGMLLEYEEFPHCFETVEFNGWAFSPVKVKVKIVGWDFSAIEKDLQQ
jgi:hypothetical protein